MLLNVCCGEELVIQCGAFALAYNKVPGILSPLDFAQSMQMPAERKGAITPLCYCKNGFGFGPSKVHNHTLRITALTKLRGNCTHHPRLQRS